MMYSKFVVYEVWMVRLVLTVELGRDEGSPGMEASVFTVLDQPYLR